ncbi:hypothetical protein A2U01_0087327, partial [Trifolium medium]|nr:hypothetical protein [Trifolium medium]
NPAKPSATIKNKKGDKGSPCRSPLPTLKSAIGLPLTNMDIELSKIQALIHFNQPPEKL